MIVTYENEGVTVVIGADTPHEAALENIAAHLSAAISHAISSDVSFKPLYEIGRVIRDNLPLKVTL